MCTATRWELPWELVTAWNFQCKAPEQKTSCPIGPNEQSDYVADYSWSLAGLEGDKRAAALAACHERGADRLLGLIFANKGVYIKMGQHMGQLVGILPCCRSHVVI